jgi:hypothetical protein
MRSDDKRLSHEDREHARRDEKRKRTFFQADKPVKGHASYVKREDPFAEDEHEY